MKGSVLLERKSSGSLLKTQRKKQGQLGKDYIAASKNSNAFLDGNL